MKKQILNLGKALNKAEQKQINGGQFKSKPDPIECPDTCPEDKCFDGVCII